jgi:hypothetical protein
LCISDANPYGEYAAIFNIDQVRKSLDHGVGFLITSRIAGLQRSQADCGLKISFFFG